MQHAKDSFYMTLRTRLAVVNPQRVVTVNGETRPAVLVSENELAELAPELENAFYIQWGAVRVAAGAEHAPNPWVEMDCTIAFRTSGSEAANHMDRGRESAALASELLAILSPASCAISDYTVESAVALGTFAHWTPPQFSAAIAVGNVLEQSAKVKVLAPLG